MNRPARHLPTGPLLAAVMLTAACGITAGCGAGAPSPTGATLTGAPIAAPPPGGSATDNPTEPSAAAATVVQPTAADTPIGDPAVSVCPVDAGQATAWFGQEMVARIDVMQPQPLVSETVTGNTTFQCGFVAADGSNPANQDYPALLDLSFSVGESASRRWAVIGPTYPGQLNPKATWLGGLDAYELVDGAPTDEPVNEASVTVHTDDVVLDVVAASYGGPTTLDVAHQRLSQAVTAALGALANS